MSSAIARERAEILNKPAAPSLVGEIVDTSNAVVNWFSTAQTNSLDFFVWPSIHDLSHSRTLGESYSSILEQLEELEAQCSLPNWDGEGAEAVSPAAVVLAKCLAVLLAKDFPQPEVTVGKRGEVVFDWIENQKRMVTVYVAPSGLIRFAYVRDGGSDLGSFVFTGRVDPRLTTFIHKLSE